MRKRVLEAAAYIGLFVVLCALLWTIEQTAPIFALTVEKDPNVADESSASSEEILNEYILSNTTCFRFLGMDTRSFYETKGKGSSLENGYTHAELTKDNYLLLQLTDSQVEEWKNSNAFIQILQKVVGEEKRIVTHINPITTPIYSIIYENAGPDCGIEISDDFSKVIIDGSRNTDPTLASLVLAGCLGMQFIEGRPDEQIGVEYICHNAQGEVIAHGELSLTLFIYKTMDECKKLKEYEQISANISEYYDPSVDDFYDDMLYDSFWGMNYQSSNIEYEIFAYEFFDKEAAFEYYLAVTDRDETMSDQPAYYATSFIPAQGKYQRLVVKENKAYRFVTSAVNAYQIEQMLAEVFSIDVFE